MGTAESNKKWRQKDPVRTLEIKRTWQQENRERVNAYVRAYRKRNLKAVRERVRRWREKNKERVNAQKSKWAKDHAEVVRLAKNKHSLKRRHGLTQEQVEQKLSDQNGRCSICLMILKKVCCDHDHVTGRNRDLLCGHCNSLLGFARENIEVLKRSIEYLERHNNSQGGS